MSLIIFSNRVASNSIDTLANLGVSNVNDILPGGPLTALFGSAAMAYAMFKGNVAYAGPCVQISVGGVLTDIGFGADGWVDGAAILAAAGSSDALVNKWYNQNGGSVHAVAPTGQLPLIATGGALITGVNGKPAVQTYHSANAKCLTVAYDVASSLTDFNIFSAFDHVSGTVFNAYGNLSGGFNGIAGPTYLNGVFDDQIRAGGSAYGTGNSGAYTAANIDLLNYSPSGIKRYLNGAAAGGPTAVTYAAHNPEFCIGTTYKTQSVANISTLKHQLLVLLPSALSTDQITKNLALINAKLAYY